MMCVGRASRRVGGDAAHAGHWPDSRAAAAAGHGAVCMCWLPPVWLQMLRPAARRVAAEDAPPGAKGDASLTSVLEAQDTPPPPPPPPPLPPHHACVVRVYGHEDLRGDPAGEKPALVQVPHRGLPSHRAALERKGKSGANTKRGGTRCAGKHARACLPCIRGARGRRHDASTRRACNSPAHARALRGR